MRHSYQIAYRVMREYYHARGEQWPADEAKRLLVLYVQAGFRWRPEAAEHAYGVLARANFDVVDLAQNFLQFDMVVHDLRSFDTDAGAPVFGAAFTKSHSFAVCDRTTLYQPLFRSTVVHEVAHLVLDSQHAEHSYYAPHSAHRPRTVYAADKFMVGALLPKALLTLGIVVEADRRGIASGEALRGANTSRGLSQWRHIFFPSLIDQLCVSREMIAITMWRFGYFSPGTLDYHKTYALKTRWWTPGMHRSLKPHLQAALRRAHYE